MSEIPKYAHYNWWPISVTVGGTAAFLIGTSLLFGGGNEHGASHTSGLDTMPTYAIETPVSAIPAPENVPAHAKTAAAWVCQGFVFVDTKHQEVIVNPLVDPEAQRPLDLIDVDKNGANFSQAQPRDNFTLYRFVGGRLINDGDGRLNRCYGDTPVSVTQVHNADGDNRYVLTDFGSTVQAGDEVSPSALTAVHEGLVHAQYTMTPDQIDDFIGDAS
jgi:hypothetical protein